MAVGPGKYDSACTQVREETGAAAVMLVVVGGEKGSGFSMQAIEGFNGTELANFLEQVAKQIKADYDRMLKSA